MKRLLSGLVIVGILILLYYAFESYKGFVSSSAQKADRKSPQSNVSIFENTHQKAGKDKLAFPDDSICTGECVGYQDGYAWAKEHHIDNADTCEAAGESWNSPAFLEGCMDYLVNN